MNNRGDQADRLARLFERIQHGDATAFDAFYDELAPLVHGVCLRVISDPTLAQESAQETFLQLWQQAPAYREAADTVRSWACTIAHRRAVDCVRSTSARHRREDAVANDPTSAFRSAHVQVGLDSRLTNVERARAMDSALAQLVVAERESIELAYFRGLTYREVAEVLQIPAGTVTTRIRDGLTQLRRLLGPTIAWDQASPDHPPLPSIEPVR